MKFFLLSFILLSGISSFTQTIDSLKKIKWINYNRTRGRDDWLVSKYGERTYITSKFDTLRRVLYKNGIGNDVLSDISYLHGEKNGFEIVYYSNGVIAEINYYLNDRIWETISAADSSGKLLFPGTLHDGNGTKINYYTFSAMNQIWSMTYKNGLPEGEFYKISEEGIIKGNLTYKKDAINYNPAKRCTYINSNGDTTTTIIDDYDMKKLFPDSGKTASSLLKTAVDSLPQLSQDFVWLSISFSDPAVIPAGIWVSTDEKGFQRKKVEHDNNGNAIRITYFDISGKIVFDRKFPPCNKRKIVKYNPDGSFFDEDCMPKY